MNINLLSAAMTEVTKGNSFLVALLGFSIVILVLVVLVAFFTVFKYVYRIKWLREDYVSPKKQSADEKSLTESTEIVCDDSETVAAITAAITCILAAESKTETLNAPFIIRNIKRIK